VTGETKNSWAPERIKTLRKKLDLTQKELAERLGVHVITVTRWETGAFEPSGLAAKELERLET
jgi:DNA-binding transcriptional regulator YiaG